MRKPLFMSSQKATSDQKLRKKHEIKEAVILNVQTTVFDFQMTTRSPIFTYSLKNISKLVLKRLVYITFWFVCTGLDLVTSTGLPFEVSAENPGAKCHFYVRSGSPGGRHEEDRFSNTSRDVKYHLKLLTLWHGVVCIFEYILKHRKCWGISK